MNPFSLTIRELRHRWKTSLLVVLLVSAIVGALTYFTVNNAGYQKEISRNARDIGSNVVILPATADQLMYHVHGGYTEDTMPSALIEQLIEHKASLNHLIPMVERQAICTSGDEAALARIVGIAASIPMPGRPKSPMQKSIDKNQIQLGSILANRLGIGRDDTPEVTIIGKSFRVSRVNRSTGTWQDSAALMDLDTAQQLFGLENRLSRIEAIECTSEQCEQTGLKSDVILANELSRITDQATILRRESIANARSSIRLVSRENLRVLQNALWLLLTASIIVVSSSNSIQRKSEIGVLQALGFGQTRVVSMFMLRAIILTVIGATLGIFVGAWSAQAYSELFVATGQKFSIDWNEATMIGVIAVVLATLASSLPAMVAASKHPAQIIGKEN